MLLRHGLCAVALLELAACSCGGDSQFVKTENYPPTVHVVSPTEGAQFNEGDSVELVATFADDNGLDDVSTIIWSSDQQGVVGESDNDGTGTAKLSTASLIAGTHTIEVTVQDQAGEIGEDVVTVHVQGEVQNPTALVLAPNDNGQYLSNAPLVLEGRVSDLQQAPDTLTAVWKYIPAGQVSETIITQSIPDANGNVVASWDEPLIGAWIIQLEVIDQDTNKHHDDVAVIIIHPDDADLDGDGYPGRDDCDDYDFDTNPGRNEQCDGVDRDCSADLTAVPPIDGIDDKDGDGDGHIDASCNQYTGLLPIDDCVDTNASIYLGAPELPDNADNNCDGETDEGTNLYDDDGDCACEHLSICNGSINSFCTSTWGSDCDDTDPALNQDDFDNDNATTCDGDCDDNDANLNLRDSDSDTYTTCDGDCNDFDPTKRPSNCESNYCSDGLDNDGDTLVDCLDVVDCGTSPACVP